MSARHVLRGAPESPGASVRGASRPGATATAQAGDGSYGDVPAPVAVPPGGYGDAPYAGTVPEDPSGPPKRLRRRRRLLAWSAPLVLLALLVGSVAVGVTLGNLLATRHYEAGRYLEAADQYAAQQPFTEALGDWWPGVEPWRAEFNSGTARYRGGDYAGAVDDLRRALEEVPPAEVQDGSGDQQGSEGQVDPVSPECRVRTNLSLALEAMGDDALAADDLAAAGGRFAEAQEALAPCLASEENRETTERQREKEEDTATEDPAPTPSEGPTEDPTEPPTAEPGEEPTEDPTAEDPTAEEPTAEASPTPDPQQEELEQRNREAERDRQEQQQERGGGFGGGQNW